MTVSGYQLRPDFVTAVRKSGERWERLTKATEKVQWVIGELAVKEWRFVERDAQGELTKEHFQMMASAEINAALPRKLLTNTGQTLRRWMDTFEAWENLYKEIELLKDEVPYDCFRLAPMFAKLEKNKGITPLAMIVRAYREEWTADDMEVHYGKDKTPVHEYDRVIGWLDGLQGAKFEWVKDKAQRTEMTQLAARMREIAESWK